MPLPLLFLSLFREKRTEKAAKRKRKAYKNQNNKGTVFSVPFSLSKNPGVDKGPQPLMFNPALTTCASERMKTHRFSFFAGFAARELMREAKPVKLKKVAFSHFFDTLKGTVLSVPFYIFRWLFFLFCFFSSFFS
ncbi:MAG: hypothetical protein ACI4N0_05385 [Christensenellales bacterium]